jgi:serine/threonine protein kinase
VGESLQPWGDYRLGHRLGHGAQGVVFAARAKDGSECAIKLFSTGTSTQPTLSFQREIEALKRLEHPGIVRILDAGVHEETLFLVTERVEGVVLEAIVSGGGCSPSRALDIALGVARALEFAHAQGIVHRDLKPGNVMLDCNGGVRLLDFGLSKDLQGARLTAAGEFLGSPRYAAPEQLEDSSTIDARADVYGLGALLYSLIAGRPPYAECTSLEELYLRVHSARPPALRVDDLPEPGLSVVNEVLSAALAVDREQRFLDMASCALALERAQEVVGPASAPGPETELPPARLSESGPWRVGSGDLLGSYRLGNKLGRGAMGEVYSAVDERLGRRVAVKLLLDRDSESGWRFAEEARATAQLNHPHVVHLYEIGEHEGRSFLVQELVEGENLASRIKRGALPVQDALRLVAALARGVQHAHEHGVLHRDLKPANVLLGAGGEIKVADFGIARRMDRATLTHSGATVGTPAYMSLEQFRGAPSTATDVYSLGVILYEVLTGELPFDAPNMMLLLGQIADQDPIPPTRLRPELPPFVDALVAKAMARDPSERHASAGALADELERLASGRSSASLGRSIAVGVVVLVVLGGGALAAWAARDSEQAALGAAETPTTSLSQPPTPAATPSAASIPPPGAVILEAERHFLHEVGAKGGTYWSCEKGGKPGFLCFGPPAKHDLRAAGGQQAASFRLWIESLDAIKGESGRYHDPILVLDVYDASEDKIVATRELLRIDFAEAKAWQEFLLPFWSEPHALLEYRAHWRGRASLRLDRVAVFPWASEAGQGSRSSYAPLVFEAERDLRHRLGRRHGDGWQASPGPDGGPTNSHSILARAGYLSYGPFTRALPGGWHVATFRLMVQEGKLEDWLDAKVVHLTVNDITTGETLAELVVQRRDFHRTGVYQDFELSFRARAGDRVSVRTMWGGHYATRLDRVTLSRPK